MRNPFLLKGAERDEFLLMLVVAALGICTLWNVIDDNMMYFDFDTRSHLNVARMTLDNLTPGFNQLGIWNPLLHILLQPFIWVWPFYTSGVAGFCLLIPCLFLSVVFLRRIIVELTTNELLGSAGGLLLALHPYALFFAVVPMTEMLQMTCNLGSAYFLTLWLKRSSLKFLLYSGLFAALSCMARFESLGLALAIGIVIVIHGQFLHKKVSEIFALLQLFFLVALLGMAYLVIYGVAYMDGPLSFLSLASSSEVAQQKTLLFTFQIVTHGLFHIHGIQLLIGAICAILVLIFFARSFKEELYVLFVLINPLIVVFYALYTKAGVILWVPELPRINTGPPIGYFAGIRFLLSSTPFVLLSIFLGLSLILKYAARLNRSYVQVLVIVVVTFFIGSQSMRLFKIENAAFPAAQKSSQTAFEMRFHLQIAEYLKNNYDYGLIIYSRISSDILQYHAQIPLKNYIYTANYPYFDQAVRFPWLFLRWVILPTTETSGLLVDMKYSDDFNKYFEKVLAVPATKLKGFTVYRLREDILREDLLKYHVNTQEVPSLWKVTRTWDTNNINRILHLEDSPWHIERRYSSTKKL